MTGTIGMMTEGGARRVAQEEVVVEVVEAMVERMDGRPCPHVWPVGHSMRRLTLISSGTSSSPPADLSVCTEVLRSITRLSLYLLMDHMNSNTEEPP